MIESGPDSKLLNNKPEALFKHVTSNNNNLMVVKKMVFCNTSSADKKIYLCISNDIDTKKKGAIIYGLILDPYETISLPDRRIRSGESLIAWAETENDVSFSFDIYENV